MAVILDVTVVPLSGKNDCVIDENGKIKWYLKSAPEKGKANQELVRSIAGLLCVPQNTISILTGSSGRKKRVKIDTILSKEDVLKKISDQK